MLFNGLDRPICGLGDLLQNLACKRPRQTGSFRGLNKMASLDLIETVVPTISAIVARRW